MFSDWHFFQDSTPVIPIVNYVVCGPNNPCIRQVPAYEYLLSRVMFKSKHNAYILAFMVLNILGRSSP